MKLLGCDSRQQNSSVIKQSCNHPLAVLVDPTESEIHELEAMLAKCPNCSQWAPGDGPIMAILSGLEHAAGAAPLDPMGHGWSKTKSIRSAHGGRNSF